MKPPIRVAITGAAGNIGYALTFRLASGEVFGPDQPVILHLVEVPPVLKSLDGVEMELQDCSFDTLAGVKKVSSDNLEEGFGDCNWVLCVGSIPRKEGMERGDLIRINGPIFTNTGKAIQAAAAKDVRVVVVGNPCNTNCLIAMSHAPDVPRNRWFAMTRLDQNRAVAQLASVVSFTRAGSAAFRERGRPTTSGQLHREDGNASPKGAARPHEHSSLPGTAPTIGMSSVRD